MPGGGGGGSSDDVSVSDDVTDLMGVGEPFSDAVFEPADCMTSLKSASSELSERSFEPFFFEVSVSGWVMMFCRLNL